MLVPIYLIGTSRVRGERIPIKGIVSQSGVISFSASQLAVDFDDESTQPLPPMPAILIDEEKDHFQKATPKSHHLFRRYFPDLGEWVYIRRYSNLFSRIPAPDNTTRFESVAPDKFPKAYAACEAAKDSRLNSLVLVVRGEAAQ